MLKSGRHTQSSSWLSWYRSVLDVADRLPVVVRFPAVPRVRLKTVDPPKGNGLGKKKKKSGRHTQPDPQSCRVSSPGGEEGEPKTNNASRDQNKTEQCDAQSWQDDPLPTQTQKKASRQQCRSGISTTPTPCGESLRQQDPNNSKQHCALAKIGNMQAARELKLIKKHSGFSLWEQIHRNRKQAKPKRQRARQLVNLPVVVCSLSMFALFLPLFCFAFGLAFFAASPFLPAWSNITS